MAVKICNLAAADIAAAIGLQNRVYKTAPAFQSEQFKSLLDHFPEGQFVAEMDDGQLVGLVVSLVISWDDYSLHHTWAEVTNNGLFDTHDMSGRTLYGAEVCRELAGYTERYNELLRSHAMKRLFPDWRQPPQHP